MSVLNGEVWGGGGGELGVGGVLVAVAERDHNGRRLTKYNDKTKTRGRSATTRDRVDIRRASESSRPRRRTRRRFVRICVDDDDDGNDRLQQ